MASYRPDRLFKTVAEIRNAKVNLSSELDTGELFTGTPLVVEEKTSDLTITNKVVNVAEITIERVTVAIGNAVQFKITGGVAGQLYRIRITAITDSSPAQTVIVECELFVTAD